MEDWERYELAKDIADELRNGPRHYGGIGLEETRWDRFRLFVIMYFIAPIVVGVIAAIVATALVSGKPGTEHGLGPYAGRVEATGVISGLVILAIMVLLSVRSRNR